MRSRSLTEQATAIVLKIVKPGMTATEVATLYEAVFDALLKSAERAPAPGPPHACPRGRGLDAETIRAIRRIYGLKDEDTGSPPPNTS